MKSSRKMAAVVTVVVTGCVMFAFVAVVLFDGVGRRQFSTPRDTLIELAEAYKAGDEQKLLATVQATTQEQELLKAHLDLRRAQVEFRDAYISRFGQWAWNGFTSRGDYTFGDELIARMKNVAVVEDGDKAFVKHSMPHLVCLVRVKGSWLIDAGRSMSHMKERADPGHWMATWRRESGVYRQHKKQVPGENDARQVMRDLERDLNRDWLDRVYSNWP